MTTALLLTPPAIRRRTASDTDRVTKRSSSNKYGGSRNGRKVNAWTPDEERILLQNRVDRVPYRQIAARLGKTDLACRLHFHQMLMAKKTPYTHPGRSIVYLSSDHPPEIHHLNPAATVLDIESVFSNLPNFGGECKSDILATALPRVQEVPARRPTISPYSPPRYQDDDPVDLSRLSRIYREHAREFWSAVAAKYPGGKRLTPTELESAFFEAQAASGSDFGYSPANGVFKRPASAPVSRETSVDMSGMQHVRGSSSMSIAGKVSVESLLNHSGV